MSLGGEWRLDRRFAYRAVLAAVLVFGVAACTSEQPVSAADKAIFLRAGDLEKFGFSYENAEAYETFSKVRNFDGTHQLSYQFETPDSEEESPLYIYITVSIARHAADAVIAQKAEKLGLLIGFKSEGAEEREVPGTLPFGDDAQLSLVVKGEHPIGNIFSLRDQEKTYLLVLTGVYFDSTEHFANLIGSKMERLAAYSP
jgi:hypothetical protein